MLGALISLAVNAFVLVVQLCVVVPVKLFAAAMSLLGPMISWGVWLALVPLKVLLLPFKLLA
mgnify:CR=1 FL=1